MRIRLAIIFITSLSLWMTVSFGQDNIVSNLLDNGDFEGSFIELDGADPRNVAESWTPWHTPPSDSSPSFANHDPNYDEETDRVRLADDGKAQKYFTLFATHQGGIYQEVDSLTGGTTYRFSIYAYVWSSSFEDTDFSEDPGDVVVRVGIDPNGGADATSDDIIWSTAATFFYDAYRQYAVIATAEGDAITVFVESTVSEPRANNYIYLDDAVLEAVSESVVVVEDTPTQETDANLDDAAATETAASGTAATLEPVQDSTATGPSTPLQARAESETPGEASTAAPEATSTPSPELTPTSAATEETATPEASASPDAVTHIVVVGDMVSSLAQQYNSSVEAIRSANDLNASSVIFVGQQLIIPVNVIDVGGASAVAAFSAQSAPSPSPTPTATFTAMPTATSTPTATFTMTPSPTATPVTHQVLPGDTLEKIAARYDTTVELIANQNSIANVHQIDVGQILVIPTPAPPTPTPTPIPTATIVPTVLMTPGSYIIYIVQVGDTLGAIASAHDTTVQAIVDLNGITNASRIYVGQELQIPSASGTPSGETTVAGTSAPLPTPTPLPTAIPVTYVVQVGDTLSQIAALYGVSIVELAQLNGIINYDALSVGQVLTIPG